MIERKDAPPASVEPADVDLRAAELGQRPDRGGGHARLEQAQEAVGGVGKTGEDDVDGELGRMGGERGEDDDKADLWSIHE